MPTEILTIIVGELSQDELQSQINLQNSERVGAIRSCHQNIRSLCLTSKRVESIARPLLFRTITVPRSLRLNSCCSYTQHCERIRNWDFT